MAYQKSSMTKNIQVFTDAFKNSATVTASGIYLRYQSLHTKSAAEFRQNSHVFIFKEELFGIYYAPLMISAYGLPVPMSIYTDSLSSVKTAETDTS
jgi:hypothetical protein